jgi:hypothetical protein
MVAVGRSVGVSDGKITTVGVGTVWRVARISFRMTFVNPVKYTSTARESKPMKMGRR